MKRILLCVLLSGSFTLTGLSQKITLYKTLGGARFEMDTVTLSPRQVLEAMKDNPLAYDEFKKAKINYSASGGLGFAGGVLVAFPIVTAIAGGKPEWTLAAAGGALLLGTIPLNNAFRRHAQNALDEYNKSFTSRMRTNFYILGSGAKIVIRF